MYQADNGSNSSLQVTCRVTGEFEEVAVMIKIQCDISYNVIYTESCWQLLSAKMSSFSIR